MPCIYVTHVTHPSGYAAVQSIAGNDHSLILNVGGDRGQQNDEYDDGEVDERLKKSEDEINQFLF
jgi:hypothetical protein